MRTRNPESRNVQRVGHSRRTIVPHPSPLPIQGEGIKREAKEKDPGFFPVRLRSGLRLVEAELSRSARE